MLQFQNKKLICAHKLSIKYQFVVNKIPICGNKIQISAHKITICGQKVLFLGNNLLINFECHVQGSVL